MTTIEDCYTIKPADRQRALGWNRETATDPKEREHLRSYLALQLAAAGINPPVDDSTDSAMTAFSRGMLDSLREKTRLLSEHRPPIDERIEAFLANYFAGVSVPPMRLPSRSIVLDRHGMARELSLPVGGNSFETRCLNRIGATTVCSTIPQAIVVPRRDVPCL